MLIEGGADLNAVDDKGITPLMDAPRNEHACIIELLTLEEASIDAASDRGQTALHFGAATGDLATVKALLDGGIVSALIWLIRMVSRP